MKNTNTGFYNADGTALVSDVAKKYNVTLDDISLISNVPVSALQNATLNDMSYKTHLPVDTLVKMMSDIKPTKAKLAKVSADSTKTNSTGKVVLISVIALGLVATTIILIRKWRKNKK